MYQNSRLKELIQEARLQIRQASGELTEEDIAAVDRKIQAEKLEAYLLSRLGGLVTYLALHLDVFFEGNTAVARFSCHEKTFHLRPLGGTWRLSLVDYGFETTIAEVRDDDPLFKQRILVAIGDHV